MFENLAGLRTLCVAPANFVPGWQLVQDLDVRRALQGNGLTSLNAGVFDALTSLQALCVAQAVVVTSQCSRRRAASRLMYNNQLASLPAGIFDNLSALQDLYVAPSAPARVAYSARRSNVPLTLGT